MWRGQQALEVGGLRRRTWHGPGRHGGQRERGGCIRGAFELSRFCQWVECGIVEGSTEARITPCV